MSLSSALDSAKSSLAAAQTQTALISRNIANVNTVGATRKYAEAVTGPGGQVQILSITQSSNTVLFRNMLDASSAVGRGNVIANGLDRMSETFGDTELGRSPAALITKFGDALGTLAASPGNYELARNASAAAGDLATSIKDASDTVQTIRRDADAELVFAAEEMNKLLATIEDLNRRIVSGTRSGGDVTDFSDQRDRAVVSLSSYVGVTSQVRGDNDLVLYTDSGVTLFETTARAVEYSGTPGLNATVPQGNAFRIDGVAVTGENAYMPLKSGSVAGLVSLRDDIMVTQQTQLDEIARGLIQSFREISARGAVAQGMFTAAGISTSASVPIGSFIAGSIAAGDVLTFDFLQGDTTYRATHTFAGVPDAATYPTALQSAINDAVPIGGGTALGAGKVTVGSSDGGLMLSSNTAGALGIGITAIGVKILEKDGGLAEATVSAGGAGTPAAIAIGAFDAGSIEAGDTLTFDFTYDDAVYSASHTFTATPADGAAFETILAGALASARPRAGGEPLGAGNIAVTNTAGALGLQTVASGTSKRLGLSSIGTIPANPQLHTGGIVTGQSETPIVGLAQSIGLAARVVSNPTTIRDGVVHSYNSTGAGGFTTRLNELADSLTVKRSFSETSGADPDASIADYAASSISWLQAARQDALSETEYKTTLLEQTQKTLSNVTGINMDEQLTKLIEIERSYQASSKLISTIDEMLQTLLNSI